MAEERERSLLALAGWSGRRERLKGLALALFTCAILALLLSRIEFAEVRAAFARMPAEAWLGAAAITLVLPLNLATRWWFVMGQMGLGVSWRRALVVLLGIHPLSISSPSRIADTLRAYGFRRQGIAVPVLGGILAERLLDVLVLAAAATLSALWLGRTGIAAVAGAIVLAVVTMLIFARALNRLPLRPAWRQTVERFAEAAAIFRRRPQALAGALAMTLLHWGLGILLVLVLIRGAGAEVGFPEVAAALPLAIFIGLVPVTFGGIGTRDAAFVALMAGSAAAPECLAASLLYTVYTYLPSAVVGLTLTRRALDL